LSPSPCGALCRGCARRRPGQADQGPNHPHQAGARSGPGILFRGLWRCLVQTLCRASRMSEASLFHAIDEVRRRSTEAILATASIIHEGLHAELRARLGSLDADHGGVLQEPVIEGARPYVAADVTMQELAGSLLSAKTIEAL